MRFFIIHGSYGDPNENWFPWLKEQLERNGHEVVVPSFPTPENQALESWMDVINPLFPKIDADTVFIGHSLGPAFILSVLERIDVRVKACFFVAGFVNLLGNEAFDNINRTFVAKEFNWEKIRHSCQSFHVYHSDNDPYVPLSRGEELAEGLGVKLNIVKSAGHFNEEAGYTKFEGLFEDIIRMD